MKWFQYSFGRLLVALVAVLALLSGTAVSSCVNVRDPAVPVVTSGGQTSQLGGAAGDSASFGGQSSGGAVVAGAGGTSATSAKVAFNWPECAPKAAKAKARDVERYRRSLMPAKPKAMHRRARASYVLVDVEHPKLTWDPLGPTLNQIDGSCTGNSAVYSVVSLPWTWSGTLDALELEQLAIGIYSDATRIDPYPGTYPPDDTGSDGESVMRVMQTRGLVESFVGGFTFEGLQRSLQSGPCIVGTNWYTGMFSPDRCGQLELSGVIEGAHEWKIDGIDYERKLVRGLNSWGGEFGARVGKQGGFFVLKFGDVQRLLAEGGDFHCPFVR